MRRRKAGARRLRGGVPIVTVHGSQKRYCGKRLEAIDCCQGRNGDEFSILVLMNDPKAHFEESHEG